MSLQNWWKNKMKKMQWIIVSSWIRFSSQPNWEASSQESQVIPDKASSHAAKLTLAHINKKGFKDTKLMDCINP